MSFIRYDFTNKDIHSLLETGDDFLEKYGDEFLEDFIPGLIYVYKTRAFHKAEEVSKIFNDFIRKKFREEEKIFDRGTISLRYFPLTSKPNTLKTAYKGARSDSEILDCIILL